MCIQTNKFLKGLLVVFLIPFLKAESDIYDAIVLGAGIKECILSQMLVKIGKKVLHIDRGNNCGGDCISFNPLEKLFSKFNVSYTENEYGRGNDWNVDTIPKFIKANGKFAKLLMSIGLSGHLQLKSVESSFVFNDGKMTKQTASDGNQPIVFPLFGMGEMNQACAKLSNVLLNKTIDEIVPDEIGVTIKSGSEVFKAKHVYCDPSYVPHLVKKTAQVVRAICLQNSPISGTRDAPSAQIVVSKKQAGRQNDVYVSIVGSHHKVASNGWFIATVSTTVETKNPVEEIQKELKIIGNPIQKFITVSDYFEPNDDGAPTKIFISKSYDASVDFENVGEDILHLFKRGTLKDFDLKDIKTEADYAEGDW